MKRKEEKRTRISTIALATFGCILLTACGSNASDSPASVADEQQENTVNANGTANTEDADKENADTTSDGEVKIIKIGTNASPRPWLYTQDDGTLSGYDAEVVYAVDSILPQYQFEFEITEFQSIFTGIDSGIYQMGVNNISWKKERAEKYLYGDEYVGLNKAGILIRKGYDEIHSLEDLGGKKTYAGTSGLYSQIFIESYNEAHPDNPILLGYTEAETLKQYQDLDAGAIDFLFSSPVTLPLYTEEYPELREALDFAPISDDEAKSIEDPYSYFIYPKTEEGEQLKKDVDEALRKLKEDGTISKLGLKYYGYDTVEGE